MSDTLQSTSTWRKKLDRFWAGLFLTAEGRPKSAKLLYSFCLSLVFMVVYGLCYWFLVDPLEHALASYSPGLRNLFEAAVPGLAGSILCCSLWFLFKDKSYLLCVYIWLTVFAVAAGITLLLLTGQGSRDAALYVFLLLVPAGLVSGGGFSWYMYLRWRRAQILAKPQAGKGC
jgi:hypothetical protein